MGWDGVAEVGAAVAPVEGLGDDAFGVADVGLAAAAFEHGGASVEVVLWFGGEGGGGEGLAGDGGGGGAGAGGEASGGG